MDERLQSRARYASQSAMGVDELAARRERKRAGGDAGLDLSLPHGFEIVGVGQNLVYGDSLRLLRNACVQDGSGRHPFVSGVYRPLTFKETVLARVEDYNGQKKLWDSWLDSCTGVAYKDDEIKIVSVSEDLLHVPAGFRNAFLPVDFGSLDGVVLRRDGAAYNEWLLQEDVVRHPAWLAAVEGDEKLLKEYARIAFAEVGRRYNRDTAMVFWLADRQEKEFLRPLCAVSPEYDYYALGFRGLGGSDARFARVCPR